VVRRSQSMIDVVGCVTLVIPAKVTTRGEGESGHDRTASNKGRSEKDASDAWQRTSKRSL